VTTSAAHPHGEELVAFALGELDDQTRDQLDLHLDDCDACREQFVGLVETLSTVAYAADPQRPPSRLRTAILDQATAEPRTVTDQPRPAATNRRAWRSWWAPGILAGAVAVVTLIMVIVAVTGSSPTTRSVALRPVEGTITVTGTKAVLESAAFTPPPAGRIYELWVIHNGRARPAGLFATVQVPITLPGTVVRGDTVAVTQEPAGGSPQPTSTPLATAPI
jgi:anti-sigma-K factor RskA